MLCHLLSLAASFTSRTCERKGDDDVIRAVPFTGSYWYHATYVPSFASLSSPIESGKLYAWGEGGEGQLGNGETKVLLSSL